MRTGRQETMDHVYAVVDAVDALRKAVGHHDSKYHLAKLLAYADALFERAPFRVGDRVKLIKVRQIDEKHSWGWLGAKHFLVVGAMAKVVEVDFRDGAFCADILFDDESWIDHRGVVHPVEEKSRFCLWEGEIERVPTPVRGEGNHG